MSLLFDSQSPSNQKILYQKITHLLNRYDDLYAIGELIIVRQGYLIKFELMFAKLNMLELKITIHSSQTGEKQEFNVEISPQDETANILQSKIIQNNIN